MLRVLDLLCDNELAQALGYRPSAYIVIPRWRRWLAPFMNVRSDDLRRVGDSSHGS